MVGKMNGKGCYTCPVKECTTTHYRGSTCAALRAAAGTEQDPDLEVGEISRGTGYAVAGGYVVGGGYEGLTEELDALVRREAEWLKSHFPGRNVQIRFNSNRRSGGAFIESSHNLDGEIYIKFGAGMRPSELSKAMNQFSAGEISFDELDRMIKETEDDEVYVEVGINLKKTKNTCTGTPHSGDVLWLQFASYEEAAQYLESHVQRITGKEE